MAWTIGEQWMEKVHRLQAEGKIVSPGELVRQVKQGPGTATLGEAQNAARLQTEQQAGIGADTQSALTRLESVWAGTSSEAARAGMRPLAEVASSASVALAASQGTMTDQASAFDTTKNSMVDVADEPAQSGLVGVLSPWETNAEQENNARNAAIEHNNRVYQGFRQTSDGHSAVMPIDYGQIADASGGTFTLAAEDASGPSDPAGRTAAPEVGPGSGFVGGSAIPPPAGGPGDSWVSQSGADRPGSYGSPEQPAASHRPGNTDYPGSAPGSTHAASAVPPSINAPAGTPYSFGPGAPGGPGGGYPPGGSGSGGYVAGGVAGAGGQGGSRVPGGIGSGGAGAPARGPGGPGRFTGSGPVGGGPVAPGKVSGGTTPAAGGVGRGMPMGAAGAGRGGKGEDSEHQRPEYLKEANPHEVFGYDGKATPPVIGDK